jgi:hypothetical protein
MKKKESKVDFVLSILLVGALILFAGVPAVQQAMNITEATSKSVK